MAPHALLRLATPFLASLGFGLLLGAPRPSRADDAPKAPGATASPAVDIATVEHTRGDPARLDPYLTTGADAATRRQAIRALGRLGDRKGVEERLRALLRRGGADLPIVLAAAGLSEVKGLVPDVLQELDRDPKANAGVVLAAVGALGALGDVRVDGYLVPFLEPTTPAALRITALDALARLGAERALESVAILLDDADPGVRRSAAGAAWRVGGARRKARSKPDAPWAGDAALAARVAATAAKDADPETRLFALRALNTLTPKALLAQENGTARPDAALLVALADPDPRIVADLAFRLGAAHEGADRDAALGKAAAHDDPLVRQTVVEALREKASDATKALLQDRAAHEPDARVREALAISLAGAGALDAARTILARLDRPGDATAKALTEARVWLAAKAWVQAMALAEVPGTPAMARAEVLDGLAAAEGLGAPAVALARRAIDDPDVIVRANAVVLLGKAGGIAVLPELVAFYAPERGRADQDFRGALVAAVAELTQAKDADPARLTPAFALFYRATTDPSAAIRLAAREAWAKLPSRAALASVEDPQPNEWQGLPRPKAPVLGLDLTVGGQWLGEAEILQLADAIRAQNAHVLFETTAGPIRVELDAEQSPVHAVNLVLLAAAGTYDGTPWHRVVPAFVIQGGDPRGDGSGDAGYAVPDEITTHAFLRGALGMPKNTKDTGGCQVFFMHCAAPHLDGRYTCFGQAVGELGAIDRIRVGDRILKAQVVVPSRDPTAPAPK